MSSPHQKLTVYCPEQVLRALDAWRTSKGIKSRTAANLAILAEFLNLPHEIQHSIKKSDVLASVSSTKELKSLIQRITVIEESDLKQIYERLNALEEIIQSTALTPPESTVLFPGIGSSVKAFEEGGSAVPASVSTEFSLEELVHRLDGSKNLILKLMAQKDKARFETYASDRDPEGIAWTWIEKDNQPIAFIPKVNH
jgi:hypothetical protein